MVASAGRSVRAPGGGARGALGRYGEQVAVAHLEAAGWAVLDRNWRCRWGELDVVARDGDCLVGVEVKTRRSTSCGHPLESLTPVRVARLRRLLALWLAAHDERAVHVRLDAVAVLRPASGPALVEHVRGIGA